MTQQSQEVLLLSLIGEAGRTSENRLKKHKRAVFKDQNDNGVALHTNQNITSHKLRENKSSTHRGRCKRKVKEALEIRKRKDLMNIDGGYKLNLAS